tara:strand:- start:4803 stop:6677 length:1875 start_codon:yes stop_codon:yes gene_type:complete
MCNTCGCKAAEETKYRSPSKKQLRQEEAAIKDVDYMREKFQAMEVFPAGQHDIDAAREALENMYSGIEIDDIIYMTKKTGKSNAFHIFMETNRGGFNVYGRIGYPEPKIYGPMSDREYNAKISKKAKGGYSQETAFSAEGESHDYTPEAYDPISESPETYDPMSESYSAENVLFIDKTGEETIMDEFIDEGEDYDDAKEYARKAMKNMSAEGRKRRYGKRQRFDHIKGNSRYLARDAKGRWISNVGVSGSIKQDLRSNAHSKQPVGFRGLGDSDAKHAEGMVLTDAIVQWEDGFGTSSPSAPPIGIHFGAEAYTDMYPQNSAEVDGMTGNGVPVAYGSGSSQYVEPPVRMGAEEDGFTYAEEDFIPNSYGEDSALTSGRGVPQWYGSAEHEQGYNDRDDESLGMRHRGSHSQSMKDRRDESKGMTDSLHPHHPYADVSTMMAEGWEHFEAMEVFPPSYDGDLANSMSRIRGKSTSNRGAQVKSGTTPIYLTKRQGSMNRFHFFIETTVGNFNVYGRIGYPNPQVYGPMTSGVYSDKMRTKIRKGYKKSAETFENPMIDQGYYPNSYGESSAVISGNGVPQWFGSAENIVIDKPIQTGAKLGLGFILMSAGVTIASVFTGMLLGE